MHAMCAPSRGSDAAQYKFVGVRVSCVGNKLGTAKQLQHPAPKNSGFCRTGPQDDVRAQKSLSGNRMRPALQSRSTAPMLPRFQVRRPPSSSSRSLLESNAFRSNLRGCPLCEKSSSFCSRGATYVVSYLLVLTGSRSMEFSCTCVCACVRVCVCVCVCVTGGGGKNVVRIQLHSQQIF